MKSSVAVPTPEPERFDVIIVGSGSGNTLLDERFADYRCAIIDHGTFGGTCLNVGCIPTKMFVYPAELATEARRLPHLGIDATVGAAHWSKIRDRVFGRIDPISEAGRRWRESHENVEVTTETAQFIAPKVLKVGRRYLTGSQIVLASGSRPRELRVPGADEVETRLHTSDSIMRLQKLPKSLVIIGGGYIAAEFAHIFAALGVHVTVLGRADTLLPREDRDIATTFTAELGKRVQVRLRQEVSGFLPAHNAIIVQARDLEGVQYEYEAELGLLAIGREPNADLLACGLGGVAVDERGYVVVDEHQHTSAEGVWALGDVCSPSQLKHVANHEARVVQHNLLVALTGTGELVTSRHDAVPHAVFSRPQIASVGLTEQACADRPYLVGVQKYADIAYGWALEDDGTHFCKVLADPETDRLLGAHIVGSEASILIQPLVQAMAFDMPASALARGQYWIHPALPELVENALLDLHEPGGDSSMLR